MKFRSSKTWVFKMTLRELKSLQKRIERLRSKRARLRSEAQKVTPSLSGMPPSDNGSDKVGTAVAQIADISAEIDALTAEYQVHINRLSREQFVENCIFLRIVKRMSWCRIAFELTGRADTADSIRMKSFRHKW